MKLGAEMHTFINRMMAVQWECLIVVIRFGNLIWLWREDLTDTGCSK